MAKKVRKKTQNRIDYEKQVKRIKQFIRRTEKRGYMFDADIIPQEPKRVTRKAIERLRKIKPEDLYRKAVYGGEATFGEVVPGLEGLKAERKARSQKSAQTRKAKIKDNATYDIWSKVVIMNWYSQLKTFSNAPFTKLLKAWMDSLVRENGVDNTAEMLQRAYESGKILTWEVAYQESMYLSYVESILDYMPEQGVLYKEKVMDNMDFYRELADAMEESEEWDMPW